MIRAGFTFNNPLTESRWVVVESDAETGGMGWTLEVCCLPGANPDILEHRHLTWTETFKIISGVAHYKVDDVQQTAAAGDTIVMPAGPISIPGMQVTASWFFTRSPGSRRLMQRPYRMSSVSLPPCLV